MGNYWRQRKFNDKGEVIDSWKKWEKAGFRNISDTPMPDQVREQAKEKAEKIKFYKSRGLDPTGRK